MPEEKSGIVLPPGVEVTPPEDEEQEPQLSPAELLQQQIEAIRALSMDELTQGVADLKSSNRELAMAMSQDGAQLDPLAVIMQRLEAIVLFGCSEEQQARINFAFEQTVNGMLVGAQSEVRMHKLMQGLGQMPPGMAPPGARLPNGRPRRT